MLSPVAFALGFLALSSSTLATPFAPELSVASSDKFSFAKRAPAPGEIGSRCRRNKACQEAPNSARPACTKEGVCDFVCLNAPILVRNPAGDGCYPNPELPPECTRDSQCPDDKLPKNSVPLCLYNQCTWQCADGFYKQSGRCFRAEDDCRGVQCQDLPNGSAYCDANRQCAYRCNKAAGYDLFTNRDKTAYRCVNLGSDAQNCGESGNACSASYNGLGEPKCISGTCSLDCTGYGPLRYSSKGVAYCLPN